MAMPMGLIRAAMTMLPRLRAEEQLHAADMATLGAGLLRPEAARQVYARLREAGEGPRQRPRAATPVELQMFGIAVEHRALERR
jgi:hypothetical protein